MIDLRDRKGLYLDIGDLVTYAKGNQLYEGRITRIRVEIDHEVIREGKDLMWAKEEYERENE
jgi:hypothetical protein